MEVKVTRIMFYQLTCMHVTLCHSHPRGCRAVKYLCETRCVRPQRGSSEWHQNHSQTEKGFAVVFI
jgi:hypothetical protein